MRQVFDRFECLIKIVSEWLNTVGIFFLIFLMIITVIDVIGRYLFKSPLSSAYELSKFMLLIMVSFCVPYTTLKKRNVIMGMLLERLPPSCQRILNSVTGIGGAVLFCFVTVALIRYAFSQLASNTTSGGLLPIPLFPFIFIAALCSLMMFLVLMVDVFKVVFSVIAGVRRWMRPL